MIAKKKEESLEKFRVVSEILIVLGSIIEDQTIRRI
jgi:hypothetical protein